MFTFMKAVQLGASYVWIGQAVASLVIQSVADRANTLLAVGSPMATSRGELRTMILDTIKVFLPSQYNEVEALID